MTEDEFDLLTEKIKGKIKYLYFHLMGEPTLHPALPRFLEIAREKGFLPIITTNGTLLEQKCEELLKTPPHKISISIHAPAANPAFADDGYLQKSINFAKKAANNGCYVAFRLWNLGSADEAGNVTILDVLHTAFPGEWENIRRSSGKKMADYIYLEFAERFNWPDENAAEEPTDSDFFCYGLRDQVGILCDGTVVPCCLDSDGMIALGNLFESSLEDILNSPRAKAIYDGFSRRRAVEPLCRKCGFAKRFSNQ